MAAICSTYFERWIPTCAGMTSFCEDRSVPTRTDVWRTRIATQRKRAGGFPPALLCSLPKRLKRQGRPPDQS
jgi:hypothetical protein